MNGSIAFPHLGIDLQNVPKTLKLGPFSIAFYGIMIALGMTLGILMIMRSADKAGLKSEDFLDISIFAMLLGIVGARLYYVIFSWDSYRDDLLSILNLREGGLAIYGGIIAGAFAVFIASKLKHIDFLKAADICVIGLPIGQAFGRWGNFFNREAFGGYTDNLFAMRLPANAVRSWEITEEMREHMLVIDGVQYIEVHPTFLYESLWCFLTLALLLFFRRRIHFDGELLLIYAVAYGTGRFFIERLRTDQLLLPGTSVPVSMVLSAAAVVGGLVLIVWGEYRGSHAEKQS